MYLAFAKDQLTVRLRRASGWSCCVSAEEGEASILGKQLAHRSDSTVQLPRVTARNGNPEDRT